MLAPIYERLGAARGWLNPTPFPGVSLELAGIIAFADLSTITKRTVLTGTSCLLDILVLCPGIHLQQRATVLNGGEYPACGAMTTGYVFRVENPATVHFFQKVGATGHLTTIRVSSMSRASGGIWSLLYTGDNATWTSSMPYFSAVLLTIVATAILTLCGDVWGLAVVTLLMLARALNTIVIRRRVCTTWSGAAEPGVYGDLIVLLSEDRWLRLRGLVDDLKAVTSGQWLRDATLVENSLVAIAKVLVYGVAALAANMTQLGRLTLFGLLIVSVGLLALANDRTQQLHMKGRVLSCAGKVKPYKRRRDLTDELIAESGRDDWAISMGMKVPSAPKEPAAKDTGPVPVTM